MKRNLRGYATRSRQNRKRQSCDGIQRLEKAELTGIPAHDVLHLVLGSWSPVTFDLDVEIDIWEIEVWDVVPLPLLLIGIG